MSKFKQVVEFNKNVLGISPRDLGMQSEEEFRLSVHQLTEEVLEIQEAYEDKDFIALIDGLHDLEYFLLGVMYKIGLTEDKHEQIFSAIHEANTKKVRGTKLSRQGYGDSADAVKPDGWVAPETAIARILEAK